MPKETEIIFIKGCLDCPFYSWDDNQVNDCGNKAWCRASDTKVKYYQTNRLPKKCPLREKDITVSTNIGGKENV